MEFTQPLGVGLVLAVRLTTNTVTQYVQENAQMLMQQSMIHRKYHGKTGYLLGNVDMGIQEFMGMGYCVNDVQMMQTIEFQLMMSCEVAQNNHTNQLHKRIAQTNCTR